MAGGKWSVLIYEADLSDDGDRTNIREELSFYSGKPDEFRKDLAILRVMDIEHDPVVLHEYYGEV
jgi:hypothetical protein